MPTYVCPHGHWWVERRNDKVAKCICGASARRKPTKIGEGGE